MRTFTRRRALAGGALAFSLLAAAPLQAAQPVVVGDVTFPPTVQVQNRTLTLNGAGLRYKTVFKVYAAGLYLEKKATSQAEVNALKSPKRLAITMLRDIDSGELGKLFSRGMEDNMERAAFSRLIPGVLRMSEVFSRHKKLVAGDTFHIDWVPGTGTVLTIKGQVEGEPFKEPDFHQALMRIWLGPKPADNLLKDALLGQQKSGQQRRN